jgi:hypothetical protein
MLVVLIRWRRSAVVDVVVCAAILDEGLMHAILRVLGILRCSHGMTRAYATMLDAESIGC